MDRNVHNNSNDSELIKIEPQKLFSAIKNNLWKIILVTILFGALAFAYSKFMLTPMYQASASFYVNNSIQTENNSTSISNGDIVTSTKLVDSYMVILKTRDTLSSVIEYAGVDMSCGQLAGMISASAVDETEIFKVNVNSADPALAEKIATAIAHVAPERISSIIEGSSAKVVDFPIVPTSPYFPNYNKNVTTGLMIGSALSVIVVLLLEIFDVTIKNEDDLRNASDYPVLALIPDLTQNNKKSRYHKRSYSRYHYYTENRNQGNEVNEKIGKYVNFAASEAYKLLRTKLQYSFADDKNCHVIAISSAMAGEGKSISCVNLAYSLAQMDKRVLMIDCDMRLPTLAKKLSLPNYPGLSEHLTGFMNLDELIQTYCDGEEQKSVSVLTAGHTPPNPVELIGSGKMQRAITALREKFDYIILDMPPVGDVSDALVASSLADGVLMVVRQNLDTRIAVCEAVHQFEFVDSRILGFILNGVSEKATKYKKKKYNYRYGYRYGYQHAYADAVMTENVKAEELDKKDK